jgi:type VI secretion system secreted protein Hcp
MQDFHFVMKLNKATTALMKACATGEHIKTATLTARKAGKDQQEYLTFKFSDVLVSSYQTAGTGGGDIQPSDQVSLNFAKIEVEYRPQKADGSPGPSERFGFDLKTNKAF